jgi:transposase
MHVRTLFNHVCKHQSFTYGAFTLTQSNGRDCLEVTIKPRKNSGALCSICGKAAPVHDRLPERRCEFPPVWKIAVIFLYCMRRVRCPRCNTVVVERVPWVNGKSHLTTHYALFLATWAKRLSWQEVARIYSTSWQSVYAAVSWVVDYGLEHRDLSKIFAIGVDEIQYSKGHTYLTLVYQIDDGCKRLLWIGKERTAKSINGFFTWFGPQRCQALAFICSDMWKSYLNAFAKFAPHAINVLDRFHIVANLNKALDLVRREDMDRLRIAGTEAQLTKTKWILLKRPRNLTRKQRGRMKNLLKMNLRSVRAYLLKESFQHLWAFMLPMRAGQFLDQWCRDAMRSRIEPIKKMARQFRVHRRLILNYFHARKAYSSGVVEGLNNKAKLTSRKHYSIIVSPPSFIRRISGSHLGKLLR